MLPSEPYGQQRSPLLVWHSVSALHDLLKLVVQ
jgi:hypothetical protein